VDGSPRLEEAHKESAKDTNYYMGHSLENTKLKFGAMFFVIFYVNKYTNKVLFEGFHR